MSYLREKNKHPKQTSCYITQTNENTHEIIEKNIKKSAMYSGLISGVGPRYCPSIEDKIVRFSEKKHHQIFVEPEGLESDWVYPNGVSTSLPKEVQEEYIHTIKGFEKAEILQYGYAVEYDFCPPTQLWPHLESKRIGGLFFAGQINGTTGYEEAAGQGLIAGLNAARQTAGKAPWVPTRDQAYIGVLVDDLVTAGTDEPYRMFTSRAEYRLLLRQDNADRRLTQQADELGLINDERRQRFQTKVAQMELGVELLKKSKIENVAADVYLRRPEIDWSQLCERIPALAEIETTAAQQCLYDIKYEGYIGRQRTEVERQQRLAGKRIPTSFDYNTIGPLRNEAKEKLSKIRPLNLDQAKRISGITPADLALVLAYMESKRKS